MTFSGLSQDFLRTFSSLSQDFPRTFSGLRSLALIACLVLTLASPFFLVLICSLIVDLHLSRCVISGWLPLQAKQSIDATVTVIGEINGAPSMYSNFTLQELVHFTRTTRMGEPPRGSLLSWTRGGLVNGFRG